ncbi:MAG: hypothetical protein QM662_16755, partial [Gordonia sp. (in: high G+C Gram-positive bacteria)]
RAPHAPPHSYAPNPCWPAPLLRRYDTATNSELVPSSQIIRDGRTVAVLDIDTATYLELDLDTGAPLTPPVTLNWLHDLIDDTPVGVARTVASVPRLTPPPSPR